MAPRWVGEDSLGGAQDLVFLSALLFELPRQGSVLVLDKSDQFVIFSVLCTLLTPYCVLLVVVILCCTPYDGITF